VESTNDSCETIVVYLVDNVVISQIIRRKMRFRIAVCLTVAFLFLLSVGTLPAESANRITIVYDAFGKSSSLKKDWGFSAFIEYNGKRILFDTGNNADTFAQNLKALGVDLKKLDFVVISHRHGDHTSGLSYLLSVNPTVKIYAPKEGFGVFGAALPGTFYRKDESLPGDMRYYDGHPPEKMTFGTPWPGANFVWVDQLTEVAPGISLISTVSETPGTLELRELSLAIKSPKGVVLGVGCSHPGIEKILEASTAIDKHVHLIFGGLHLVTTPDPEIQRLVGALHDQLKIDWMAPGHCTGEPAFAAFHKAFGDHYLYAGLGSVIDIP
jgi:7,8-dihydropterin-6-yl-methyl-4-(beta-D-ribofuranosyl)aminobenzene 5'-phosphate synthase